MGDNRSSRSLFCMKIRCIRLYGGGGPASLTYIILRAHEDSVYATLMGKVNTFLCDLIDRDFNSCQLDLCDLIDRGFNNCQIDQIDNRSSHSLTYITLRVHEDSVYPRL
ncbi:hypothetical protein J6590_045574 [Homalodisca vitripennis]|nr:hypothetical protein J6590_045574 [Homalodisca vitripennis]